MVHHVQVARADQKILAVKLVRELSGHGLQKSLELVETKAFFEVDRDEQTLLRLAEEGRRGGVQFEFVPPLDPSKSSSDAPEQTGDFAVRYRSGPNRIHAIKLVREIEAMHGLADARDIVDTHGLICVGVTAQRAERIVALFDEIGSSVEVEADPRGFTMSEPAPQVGAGAAVHGYRSDDDDF